MANSDPEVANGSKAGYYTLNVSLNWIFAETRPIFYLACQTCKKKLTEDPSGYHCEGCQKSYKEAVPTFNFSAKVSDYTRDLMVSIIGEAGESFLGIKATDIFAMKDDTDQIKSLI